MSFNIDDLNGFPEPGPAYKDKPVRVPFLPYFGELHAPNKLDLWEPSEYFSLEESRLP